MTNAHTPEIQADSFVEMTDEHFEEEYESMGDHHRMAARHFAAAAKHHLSAAAADDEGDNEATARHAYTAYRHQLNAVQYAEIATMDNDSLEDEHDGEADNS
ncbi:hypothetical protein [Polaromonas naphthalenivorans]|uniref:DUF4167 domain-containing protein n=1 Tax=Polaromonas naphthalenivorans (strain CJ2) TaxID=365044 RepID=A1VT71_POLNA|nr:hypothetical protein [Polaromonas naphthalenivorans]ABM38849.1 hypothetical protein Pnap_3553 [Polaromonas naphthalenivorans CJ2]